MNISLVALIKIFDNENISLKVMTLPKKRYPGFTVKIMALIGNEYLYYNLASQTILSGDAGDLISDGWKRILQKYSGIETT